MREYSECAGTRKGYAVKLRPTTRSCPRRSTKPVRKESGGKAIEYSMADSDLGFFLRSPFRELDVPPGIRREPLRRVHECVFGVLALESEPVDPRL